MADKIGRILVLRFRQLFRAVKEAGFGLIIFAFVIILGMLLQGLEGVLTYSPFYAIPFCFIILLSIDFQRRDKLFLGRIFHDKLSLISLFFFENLLLISPFLIFQFFNEHFLVAFLLTLCPFLVAIISPFLKKSVDMGIKKSLSFLPLKNFEIKFSVEKRKGFFALAYLFTLLGFHHISFFLVGIFILGLLLLESFKEIESRELIHWKNGFVWKKILSNFKLVGSFMALPIFITCFFQYDLIYLIVYAVFCLFSFLFLSISYKYSSYNPLYKSKVNENIQAMFAIITLLPGGIIITFSFALVHYFKAERTMKRFV